MASIADTAFTFIGLDVHKDSISAGILEPGGDHPAHEKIFHDEASIRRLAGRFDPAALRVFYEAGPTGYGLARLLATMGVDCQVVAPSLIPTAPGGPGQDRPAGCPPARPAATGRGVDRDPHPDRT